MTFSKDITCKVPKFAQLLKEIEPNINMLIEMEFLQGEFNYINIYTSYYFSDEYLILNCKNIELEVFLIRRLPYNADNISKNIKIPLNILLNYYSINSLNIQFLSKRVTLEEYLKYPNLKWDNEYLLQNKNIPLSYLLNNNVLKCFSDLLCKSGYNADIAPLHDPVIFNIINAFNYTLCENTILIMSKYINLYTLPNISCNENISVKFILENPTLCNWDWIQISERATLYEIENLNGFWNFYDGLSYNKNLTMDFILKNRNENWNWQILSEFININDISNTMFLPYNFYSGISFNDSLTPKFVLKNSNEDWNWNALSRIMSLDFIMANPNLKWNYKNVCVQADIKFVLANLDKSLCWKTLSEVIPINDIKLHPNLPWDYSEIAKNITLTSEFIRDNMKKFYYSFNLCRIKKIDDFYYDIRYYDDLCCGYDVICEKYNIENNNNNFNHVRLIM